MDVVGDAHTLSRHYPDAAFDAVMAFSVLEHLLMPWKLVIELNRVLKPGGIGNQLEAETRSSRQGRMAEYLCRMNFVVLDELGYLPFVQSGASCWSTWSVASTSRLR